MKNNIKISLVFLLILTFISAQPNKLLNSSEIQLALEKLNVLGSVLYIAAHPDDENTGLMAYLSKEKKFRTAYLSLTRGDGGQNLIGAEKGSEIGIIRTQELLEARSIDGGEQYFTRAVDFGYSKSADETFQLWNKNEVLRDIVWIIRRFKPDVILTRFSLNDTGHGHHRASTILAKEAFAAAADPNMFPEQLKYVDVWQTKRIYWNKWRPRPEEIEGLLKYDIGVYNPLLGKSYNEIAAHSRTMHKSQGFGSMPNRGSQIEYFEYMDGDKAKESLFDNLDISWKRLSTNNKIDEKIHRIIQQFNPIKPEDSITKLIDLYKEISDLENNCWVELKKKDLLRIIQSCAGLWIEAFANDYSAIPGETVDVKIYLVNRSTIDFELKKIEFSELNLSTQTNKKLNVNTPQIYETKITIPQNFAISQPYWLEEKMSEGLFQVKNQDMLLVAENNFAIPVNVFLSHNNIELKITVPLLYKWNDRVDGELYRNFEVRPPVTANFTNNVVLFTNEKSKEIQLKLKNNSLASKGKLQIVASDKWIISPKEIEFNFTKKYEEQIFNFSIKPKNINTEEIGKAEVKILNQIYTKSLVEISYPHIKKQVYFPESEIKLVKTDAKIIKGKIGYIDGSGDEIPAILKSLGYEVVMLSDEQLERLNFSEFNTIIAGIRAYNTREKIKHIQSKLNDFVKQGGTYIVQYNVNSGLQTNEIGPYKFTIGRERITEEKSEIRIINPKHQFLNFPNKIETKDFDGWVQERGLYYASQWDEKYETIIAGNDVGEKELAGGILFSKYGKGVFVYTGISFFRQLPEAIPGAVKLFINMISAGKYNGK